MPLDVDDGRVQEILRTAAEWDSGPSRDVADDGVVDGDLRDEALVGAEGAVLNDVRLVRAKDLLGALVRQIDQQRRLPVRAQDRLLLPC